MDIKALAIAGLALWVTTPGLAKDIYKCEINGAIKYQEEKCDDNSAPIHLRKLAAPLETFHPDAIKGQNIRNQESMIKERITLHQKRIRHYRKKMEAEIDALVKPEASKLKTKTSLPRNSLKNQDQATSLNNIARMIDKDSTPDKVNAIVNRYKTLIEAEQFQIHLLQQELKMSQDNSK